MSVYYELRLKVDCVKDEGWFKGGFWCDKQPMNPVGYVGMQTSFLFRGFAWPYFLFWGSDDSTNETKSGAWEVMGTGTPFTIGTSIPISKEDNFKALLLVYFNPKNSCSPELSVLAIANDKLGDPESQDKTSTHLRISIGDVLQKQYLVVFNKYTTGIEYAMRLDDALFMEMKKGQSVIITPSNATKTWIFFLNGFQTLATFQYAACRAS